MNLKEFKNTVMYLKKHLRKKKEIDAKRIDLRKMGALINSEINKA